MNDLETRLRGELGALPAPPRTMPPDTPRRVRRRRAGVVGSFAVAILAVVVLAMTVGVPRTSRPAPVQPATGPYAELPADWPRVTVETNADALIAGTVDGIAFSLFADTAESGGPCLRLEVGSSIVHRTCRDQADAPVPTLADLDLDIARDPTLGDLEANLGFVSMRTRVLDAFYDAVDHPLPILDAPTGWDVRPFLFFPPPELDGWVDALGTGDEVLSETNMCGSMRTQMGCIRFVDQIAAIPGSYTPPPRNQYGSPPGEDWDFLHPIDAPVARGDTIVEPTYGGDVIPYVDLEMPSPVDGKKIVVTYGTLDGEGFSLATYDTTGRYGSDGGGVIEFFWGHAFTATDPGYAGGGSGIEGGLQPGEDLDVLLGAGRTSDGTRYQVLYGWASTRVDHVDIRMEDGWTQRVSVQHTGPVDGFGWVLAFIPRGLGAAVPVTADGAALARWPLCDHIGSGPLSCPSWFQG